MHIKDVRELAAMERRAFSDYGWKEADFQFERQSPDTVGMIFESEDRILGYVVCAWAHQEAKICRICVHPHPRRAGVGSAMMKMITSRLSSERRQVATICVHEQSLQLQVFLRSLGFKATAVVKNYDDGHDTAFVAYRFEYRVSAIQGAGHAKQEA